MDYTDYGEPANFGGDAAGGMMGAAAGGGGGHGGLDGTGGGSAADPGAEAAAQKEQVLRQILAPEARMRLGNIRMVRPELANLVEQQLIALATEGRIQAPLTDDQLRQMLSAIRQPKREFKFNRI